MPCDPLSYTGVGTTEWNAARVAISQSYGLHIESEQGEETKSGFRLRWAYDPGAKTLEIQCLDKPRLIPCGMVNSRINSLARDCGVSDG